MNQETRSCQNCKQDFTIEPDDFDFYKKIDVPPPTFCPDCRFQRRLVSRNERSLYKGECALCGKKSLSVYAPERDITTYCLNCWNSDKWDPMSYGVAYDFSKPFFEQYTTLLRKVPRKLVQTVNVVNCDFANYVDNSKNVYMGFSVVESSENVMYAKNIDRSSYIVDSLDVSDSQTCYWNLNGSKNYNSIYLFDCRNCIDSAFLYDCADCNNCILSTNLRKKSFYINNQPFSKEAYLEKVKAMDFGSTRVFNKAVKDFHALKRSALNKYAANINCTNCLGDGLRDSKNAKYAFFGYGFENVKYAFRSFFMKDSMDITNAVRSELFYEFVAGGAYDSRLVKFAATCKSNLNDVHYVEICGSSSNLFGCAALQHKQYCILNKQYTKEEYEELIPKIIAQMNDMPYVDRKGREYRYGEFLPIELGFFAYNETTAQEYFPLAKEEALGKGYPWRDPDPKAYAVTKKPEELPDHIKDADDSILNEVIGCKHAGGCNHQCTTAFRVIKEELEFYRRMHLPLPRLCPNCRHFERLAERNPLKLWHRQCMCKSGHQHGDVPCPNEFETPYSPEREEIIYCEQCYQSEVV